MKKLLMVVFCLWAAAVMAGTPVNRAAANAARFNQLAKTVFPPVYDYLTAELVAELNLNDRTGIGIDVGGGPGDWIIRLAQAAPGIYWINTDINPHYGDYLMQTALDSAISSRVGWVSADAMALPFRDNYADVIISRGSFQFWPDLTAGIKEIQRVLKPGGTAVIGRGFAASMPEAVAREVRKKQHGGPQYSISGTLAHFENIVHELNITDYDIIVPHPELKDITYGIWLKFKKVR